MSALSGAGTGRFADAASMLRHLDNAFPYWATLVAEAREKIIANGHQVTGPDLGDQEALNCMRRILEQLAITG